MIMNIYLCGFMAAGKTTVGRILAQKLNCAYYDTDELIEKRENCAITEIFKNKGEEYFRDCETEILKTFDISEKAIISTGGGIVMRPENIEIMRANGKLVYLKASVDSILKRVNPATRPLLNGLSKQEMLEKIKYLLALREKNYYLCNNVVETDELTPAEIAEKIINLLEVVQ